LRSKEALSLFVEVALHETARFALPACLIPARTRPKSARKFAIFGGSIRADVRGANFHGPDPFLGMGKPGTNGNALSPKSAEPICRRWSSLRE